MIPQMPVGNLWELTKEEHNIRATLKVCRFNSKHWIESTKQMVYDMMYSWVSNPLRHGYEVTPLFDYEIWLMSQGAVPFLMHGLNSTSSRIYKIGEFKYYFEYGYETSVFNPNFPDSKTEYYKFAVLISKSFSEIAAVYHMPQKEQDFKLFHTCH